MTPTLFETELFGHVRGAFTDAVAHREGLLGTARNGTLFLDELAELPLQLQSKLLRSVQQREFRPVGALQRIPFRARVVSATNRDMEVAVREGSFRTDLFYRLSIVTIAVPPLRCRRDDILLLADHFLRAACSSKRISQKAAERLFAYEWPGNVRELQNAMSYADCFAESDTIEVCDLPPSLSRNSGRSQQTAVTLEALRGMLAGCNGNPAHRGRHAAPVACVERDKVRERQRKAGLKTSTNGLGAI